jgi:hypothetical protein
MSTDREVRVALALALLGRCLLCGGASSVVALFIPRPEFAHVFRAETGRERPIAYALCRRCCGAPGAAEAAEELLAHRGWAA